LGWSHMLKVAAPPADGGFGALFRPFVGPAAPSIAWHRLFRALP
jgi:hypothetical protein